MGSRSQCRQKCRQTLFLRARNPAASSTTRFTARGTPQRASMCSCGRRRFSSTAWQTALRGKHANYHLFFDGMRLFDFFRVGVFDAFGGPGGLSSQAVASKARSAWVGGSSAACRGRGHLNSYSKDINSKHVRRCMHGCTLCHRAYERARRCMVARCCERVGMRKLRWQEAVRLSGFNG